MHIYGLGELKAKTIRSWARAFGEELEAGGSYAAQPPTIAIAFTDGAVGALGAPRIPNVGTNKIHRLCMIMDCEDCAVFTDAMELHYIDMKAFAEGVNEKSSISAGGVEEAMFAKWLSVITQKEINDKSIIENACREEEIYMAVSALKKQSEDKIIRQAYQRRKDEIYFYNKERADYKREMEELQIENEQLRQQIADLQAKQKL